MIFTIILLGLVMILVSYEMLLSIAYLHQRNIVHRDLKLENWLYEDKKENSRIKLIDFGFAKVFDEETKMHQSCGSVAYVAPEVLRRSYKGGKCDMWSLGVIVFMLLSGYESVSLENARLPLGGSTQKTYLTYLWAPRTHGVQGRVNGGSVSPSKKTVLAC